MVVVVVMVLYTNESNHVLLLALFFTVALAADQTIINIHHCQFRWLVLGFEWMAKKSVSLRFFHRTHWRLMKYEREPERGQRKERTKQTNFFFGSVKSLTSFGEYSFWPIASRAYTAFVQAYYNSQIHKSLRTYTRDPYIYICASTIAWIGYSVDENGKL